MKQDCRDGEFCLLILFLQYDAFAIPMGPNFTKSSQKHGFEQAFLKFGYEYGHEFSKCFQPILLPVRLKVNGSYLYP